MRVPFGALELTWWMLPLLLLVSLALSAFLSAVFIPAARGRPTAGSAADSLVFQYPPVARWGLACLVVGGLGTLSAIALAQPPRDSVDTICLILGYAITGLLGLPLWEYVRFSLTVGPDGLHCRWAWRGRQFVRWEDVVDVSFDNPMGRFTVRSSDGCAVYVPVNVGGVGTFLVMCERWLAPSQLEPARAAYIFFGRAFPYE